MLRQEVYELLKLNGGVTGGCNPNNLITAIKEQLNRDIPSEINHEVKQQVHWLIVEVLEAGGSQRKDVLVKKWLPKICAETDKKRVGAVGAPLTIWAPLAIRGLSDPSE